MTRVTPTAAAAKRQGPTLAASANAATQAKTDRGEALVTESDLRAALLEERIRGGLC